MSRLKKRLTKYLNDKLEHNDGYSDIVEKANLQNKPKENVFYMKKSLLKIGLPCLLCLILVVGIVLVVTNTQNLVDVEEPEVVGVIQMDVNPSISFVVNEDQKIVSIYGENDEGKMIICGETYTGLKLEVAIEKILNDEKKMGYLVNISGTDLQNISFNINCNTEYQTKIEDAIKATVEDVCEKLNIEEKIDIVKSDTKDELIARAQALDPTLTNEQASEMSYKDLIDYIARCHIEKINIPTKELETLYNQFKTEKINLVECEETKKVIDGLDQTYQKLISEYDQLYENLLKVNSKLDETYYNSFVDEKSAYQIALQNMQKAKSELLEFKNKVAEMEDENPLKVVEQAKLSTYTIAYETTKTVLEEANQKAIDILEKIKNEISNITNQMKEFKENLPTEVKTVLNEQLADLETKLNQAKKEAYEEFEEKYADDIKEALEKAKAYKKIISR